GQQLYEVAYRITGRRDDADDVVQDLFMGLPEALRSYRGTGTLGAWLRALARRTALLRLRSEKRRGHWHRRAARDRPVREPPPPVDERMAIQWALDRMPDDWRAVFILKEVEGHTHVEIANALGITPGASALRLHRARRFLRDRLKGKV
ncbi:MAG: sigma-70 family RNA polymerase sigma factor, partial [Gemmatimonadota bacterium]